MPRFIIAQGTRNVGSLVIDDMDRFVVPEGQRLIASDDAGPDWTIGPDDSLSPPVLPSPEPPRTVFVLLDRRQFFTQAANAGVITQDEALAAMFGTMPAVLATLVNGLPADQRFAAKMAIASSTFDRAAPLTTTIGTAFGWTSAQIDDFWRAGAVL